MASRDYAAPFGMDLIVGQPLGAGGVQPLEFAGYPGSGLIMMRDRFLFCQMLLHLLIHFSHPLGGAQASFHDGTFTDRLAVQVREYLSHSLQGYKVILTEIHHLRLEMRPVLDWLAHSAGKLGLVHLSAAWTILDLGLMLRHFNLHQRQIKNLTPFTPSGRNAF